MGYKVTSWFWGHKTVNANVFLEDKSPAGQSYLPTEMHVTPLTFVSQTSHFLLSSLQRPSWTGVDCSSGWLKKNKHLSILWPLFGQNNIYADMNLRFTYHLKSELYALNHENVRCLLDDKCESNALIVPKSITAKKKAKIIQRIQQIRIDLFCFHLKPNNYLNWNKSQSDYMKDYLIYNIKSVENVSHVSVLISLGNNSPVSL